MCAVTCFNIDSHVLSVGATEAGIVSLDLSHDLDIKYIREVFVE